MESNEINYSSNIFLINNKLRLIFEKTNTNSDILKLDFLFEKEDDCGFIEYKRTLTSYSKKISKLLTQIHWRISEGQVYNLQSFCYYIIGIEDNGYLPEKIINDEDLDKSIKMLEKTIKNTNINMDCCYAYYTDKNKKSSKIVIAKLWMNIKKEIFNNIRIILIGESNTGKTNFFVNLQNNRQSNTFDIHMDETRLKKTLKLHHQYFNNKELQYNFHFIDTPGNSIISNIKYLIAYNVDCIIYFKNKEFSIYDNIINNFNEKFNNVINFQTENCLTLENLIKITKRKNYKNILSNIRGIHLVNENRLINLYNNSELDKYISFCYNCEDVNVYTHIYDNNNESECYVRNLQSMYKYKSFIEKYNMISIETNKIIHKSIIGRTKILEYIEIKNIPELLEDTIKIFYIIILNQVYIHCDKKLQNKIILDKIILIPKEYKIIPIVILYKKKNIFISIFDELKN